MVSLVAIQEPVASKEVLSNVSRNIPICKTTFYSEGHALSLTSPDIHQSDGTAVHAQWATSHGTTGWTRRCSELWKCLPAGGLSGDGHWCGRDPHCQCQAGEHHELEDRRSDSTGSIEIDSDSESTASGTSPSGFQFRRTISNARRGQNRPRQQPKGKYSSDSRFQYRGVDHYVISHRNFA